MSGTSYSTVKRTPDSALRSQFWYRQFREIVLLFALNDVKKLVETVQIDSCGAFSMEQFQ